MSCATSILSPTHLTRGRFGWSPCFTAAATRACWPPSFEAAKKKNSERSYLYTRCAQILRTAQVAIRRRALSEPGWRQDRVRSGSEVLLADLKSNAAADAIEEAVRRKTLGIVYGSGQDKWRGIGSGTLVIWKGRRFVLTADHVISGTNPADLRFF